jgi:hypothetical protein
MPMKAALARIIIILVIFAVLSVLTGGELEVF